MKNYIFKGIPEKMATERVLLDPGNYDFTVLRHGDPYENKKGNMVWPITLLINGHEIVDYPWTGEDQNGEVRDGIGEFLVAINRAPKSGAVPDWESVDGAHGRCRLKVEEATESWPARNRVGRYYAPKQLQGEKVLSKADQKALTKAVLKEEEPDDIPF